MPRRPTENFARACEISRWHQSERESKPDQSLAIVATAPPPDSPPQFDRPPMFTISGNESIGKNLYTVITAILAVWTILLVGKALYLGIHAAPSFDGAMNLEVARSLSDGEGYRRLFQDRELFPHEIQTNAPFIVPAAVVYRILGVGIAQSALVNIGYFLMLALCSALLMRSTDRRLLPSILGFTAITTVPGMIDFGFSGYGEIPSLAWIFVATIYYFRPPYTNDKKRAFVTGILLAFSYLTKTVMLIGVAAFAVAALTQLLFHRRRMVGAWLSDMFVLVTGFLIPILAFETWKAVSLGGMEAWANWWATEFQHIGSQAGVNTIARHSLGAISSKTLSHLHVLANHYGLPFWLTAAWVLIVLLATAYIFFRAFREERYLPALTVLCLASGYLIWWIGLTVDSRTWLRRILNGMICADLGVLMVAGYLLRSNRPMRSSRVALIICLSLVPAVLLARSTAKVMSRAPADNSALLRVSREVRQLPPDAYVFGVGWWSNPNVALLSGRHVLNFNQVAVSRLDPTRPAYVVKAPIPAYIDMINHAFAMYGLEVSPTPTYEIYRIPGFSPRTIKPGARPVASSITDSDDYPYMDGAYKPVAGFGIWLSSDNSILLKHEGSRIFELTGYAQPQAFYLYPEKLKLSIFFERCAAPAALVPTGKVFTLRIEVPENCSNLGDDPWMIRIQSNNVIDYSKTNGDFRSLSLLAKKIGFEGVSP